VWKPSFDANEKLCVRGPTEKEDTGPTAPRYTWSHDLVHRARSGCLLIQGHPVSARDSSLSITGIAQKSVRAESRIGTDEIPIEGVPQPGGSAREEFPWIGRARPSTGKSQS